MSLFLKNRVLVQCYTYNHSSFIVDTMNGFVKQETDFPFVAAVVDDASTDGTPEILLDYYRDNFTVSEDTGTFEKETDYAHIYFARHKKNRNCFFAILLLKFNHYKKKKKAPYLAEWMNSSDYLAFCDGDDFWTDPFKLQKQVSFMDAHPDFSLCFGDAAYKDVNGQEKGRIGMVCGKENARLASYSKRDCFYSILRERSHIQMLTAMCRISDLNKVKPNPVTFMMGDTTRWLDLSQFGRIHYMEDCFGIYNIHGKSATHAKLERSRFTLSKFEMRVYYCEKFHYPVPRWLKRKYNGALLNMAVSSVEITPSPLYGLFESGLFSGLGQKVLERKKPYFFIYKRIVSPINKILHLLLTKCNLIIKLILNK